MRLRIPFPPASCAVDRDPTPDFQLMHALDHCECDPANLVDGKNCLECTVFNTFTDGKYVAEKLSQEAPWAYDQLTTVPVRFENNGGDDSSFLSFQVPHFQLHADAELIKQHSQGKCGAECIRSIRFSSVSRSTLRCQWRPLPSICAP